MTCVLCGATRWSTIHTLRKCKNCGLVQVVPMPGEKEIAALYHKDLKHFDPYIAQIPVHRKYFRKKIQEIRRIFQNFQFSIFNFQLLDIGCAMGVLLEEAEKIGYRAQGTDISKDAVSYCRKKGLRVTSELGRVHGRFDVVTAFEVIEHERDPLGMMKRVHSLLKKGGVIVLTTPNHESFWRKMMGTWWVGYRHPEHVTFWDSTSLRALFKRAGFRDITIRRDIPRPFPLSFVLTRGADYIPWFGWLLRPVGKLLNHWNIINPINPWDDLIVFARK